jgi:hypothetical protein
MPAKRTESKTSKAPKAPARKRVIRRKTTTVSYEDIATRAYYLHLEGGHDPFENWLRAEHELTTA